ncbi:MAG: hypothetical protein FWF92_00310 [Oscillospiraceae bacterium]|nr:hypothetical protein [Oscillospiraceae bacterium]
MFWNFKDNLEDNKKVFSDFCEYTYKNLEMYVLKLTSGDRYLAEDIVQNTYWTAQLNQLDFHNHSNPEGWLYKTAKNLFYKELKIADKVNNMEMIITPDIIDYKNYFSKINGEPDKTKTKKLGIFLKIFKELPKKDKKLIKDHNIKKLQLKYIAAELCENYSYTKKRYYRLIKSITKKVGDELRKQNDQENQDK